MAVGGILTAILASSSPSCASSLNRVPLLLVYPSLWILTTMLTWLIFYRA